MRALVLLLPAVFAAPPALAAHPLQTEDTGTQGAGNLEIENGLARARFDGARVTTYQPQVSLGLATDWDAIVQPSVVTWQEAGQSRAGTGDTNVDAKWRTPAGSPWSFGIRAGLQLPTNQHRLGLSGGRVSEHAVLVATWEGSPTFVHLNLAFDRGPHTIGGRTTAARVSAAVVQQVSERLYVALDGGLAQDPDPTRGAWPGSLLGGLIWTARTGLDLDVGWQRSIEARPENRQWLAGLTWRFAL